MTLIVHDNPGEIELRSFTTFGVNAKPNSASPIGYFGTGLKIALATLVRLGADVTIWIGDRPHVIYTERADFRGKEFRVLRMRRKRGVTARWFSEELPYTTELGKNWEVWQALRELHSNALDERGDTLRLEPSDGGWRCEAWGPEEFVEDASRLGVKGRTRIVVSLPAYAEAHARLSEVFLPEADRARVGGVQVLNRPSPTLFYRGLRVYTPRKPCLLTWCVYHALTLTEDRTLAHSYLFDEYVKGHVVSSDDEEIIRKVLTAPNDSYEGSLDFRGCAYAPSEAFKRASTRYGGRGTTAYLYATAPSAFALVDWKAKLLEALERGEPEEIGAVAKTHKVQLAQLLRSERARQAGEPVDDEVPF